MPFGSSEGDRMFTGKITAIYFWSYPIDFRTPERHESRRFFKNHYIFSTFLKTKIFMPFASSEISRPYLVVTFWWFWLPPKGGVQQCKNISSFHSPLVIPIKWSKRYGRDISELAKSRNLLVLRKFEKMNRSIQFSTVSENEIYDVRKHNATCLESFRTFATNPSELLWPLAAINLE